MSAKLFTVDNIVSWRCLECGIQSRKVWRMRDKTEEALAEASARKHNRKKHV